MGDRGSITVKSDQPMPVLFRHWGGAPESMQELVNKLQTALKPKDEASRISDPYDRRDENACLALLVKLAVEEDGYSAYLGMDKNDGDNSDNGHYVLDLADFSLHQD